jgi:hypothetical protein
LPFQNFPVNQYQISSERRRLLEIGPGGHQIVTHEQQNILPVPELNFRHAPNFLADQVQDPIAVLFEQLLPIRRPLLIDVMGASLQRYRGREKNHRRQPHQRAHKTARGSHGEVLGHLQADRQIKEFREFKRLTQAYRAKTTFGDTQPGGIHVVTIQTQNSLSPVLLKNIEPGS